MRENQKTGLNTGLGIASLVLGTIALLVSFIPCFGILSLYISPIAAVLGGYAYYISKKTEQPSGLALGGLIVSLLAVSIGGLQNYQIRKDTQEMEELMNNPEKMQNQLFNNFSNQNREQKKSNTNSIFILVSIIGLSITGLYFYKKKKENELTEDSILEDENLLAVSKNSKTTEVITPEYNTKEKDCPNCNSTYHNSDRFCSNCGYNLTNTKTIIEKIDIISKCDACNNKINPTDNFCENCGNKLK